MKNNITIYTLRTKKYDRIDNTESWNVTTKAEKSGKTSTFTHLIPAGEHVKKTLSADCV